VLVGGILTCYFLFYYPLVALIDGCGAYYLTMVWFGIMLILERDDC
jgi:hypothetical protein